MLKTLLNLHCHRNKARIGLGYLELWLTVGVIIRVRIIRVKNVLVRVRLWVIVFRLGLSLWLMSKLQFFNFFKVRVSFRNF